MSLTRALMEGGFGTESVDTSMYDFSGNYVGESYELDGIYESLFSDIYAVDRAYLTADVIGEVKVISEGANPQALLEGAVSGAIEKLKNIFRKFLAKIKEFFAAVKRQWQLLTKKGKQFVTSFKDEINKKKGKGYKYKACKYTIDAGKKAADAVFNKCNTEVQKFNNTGVQLADSGKVLSKEDIIKNLAGKDIEDKSEFEDEFIQSLAGNKSDASELREYLEEEFRNGDTEAETFEDFEDASKGEMMNAITNMDKDIKEVTDKEKNFDKMCNNIIKALDKIEKTDIEKSDSYKDKDKIDSTKVDNAYKTAQTLSSMCSTVLSVGKIPIDVTIAALKERAAAYERILKGWLRFKPAKESFGFSLEASDGDDDDEAEIPEDEVTEGFNLIDQAMSMVW